MIESHAVLCKNLAKQIERLFVEMCVRGGLSDTDDIDSGNSNNNNSNSNSNSSSSGSGGIASFSSKRRALLSVLRTLEMNT